MLQIKPEVWFVDRQLSFKPLHFVQAPSPASSAAVQWILTSLNGRFFLETTIDDQFSNITLVSFEDPAEATLYELKWS